MFGDPRKLTIGFVIVSLVLCFTVIGFSAELFTGRLSELDWKMFGVSAGLFGGLAWMLYKTACSCN